jgi:hypothetical protein
VKYVYGISLVVVFNLAAGIAQAQVTVNCAKGQTIAAALAVNPPANGDLVLKVSGTCTEDVVIDRFSAVSIEGNPSATLKPRRDTDVPVTASTRLVLDQVTVAGGSVGVSVGPHGYVSIVDSAISGAGIGVFVWDNSLLDFDNSSVKATGKYGIQSTLAGLLNIYAAAGKTTTVTGALTGILCETTKLELNTSGSGQIQISGNRTTGIEGIDCGLHTYNPAGKISISANGGVGGPGAGLEQNGGWADLHTVDIQGNSGVAAINTSLNAAILLDNVTMTGNTAGISANQGAVVLFVAQTGISTVDRNGKNVFACHQGGHIYVNKSSGLLLRRRRISAVCRWEASSAL